MACRLGKRGPRLLPGGPTLQPGTPSRPPTPTPQRAEPCSPRIASAGFVCSAENLCPPPGAGIDSGRTGGGERRAERERGREGEEGRESERKPQ